MHAAPLAAQPGAQAGAFRLPSGGRIDRAQPVQFSFDGSLLSGYRATPWPATLLAHGKHLVARSFRYHRPRGIVAAGVEEPNALLTVGDGAFTEPNIAATVLEAHTGLVARTQNAWPSVHVRPDGRQQPAVRRVCGGLLLQDLHALAQGLDVS